jgi:hypothetical protein
MKNEMGILGLEESVFLGIFFYPAELRLEMTPRTKECVIKNVFAAIIPVIKIEMRVRQFFHLYKHPKKVTEGSMHLKFYNFLKISVRGVKLTQKLVSLDESFDCSIP